MLEHIPSSGLIGKRALVTAGGQGIGKAIALDLLASGCNVIVHYFSSEVDCDALLSEAKAREDVCCQSLQADLTSRQEARSMVQQAIKILGGLDILVNNAGSIVERRYLEEVDEAIWQKIMTLNLDSALWVTQAAQDALIATGSAAIVNLASLAGRKGGHPGSLAYSTSKGAILTWTRALANELGPKGVRVNAVAPGLILGTSFHANHSTDESIKKTIAGIPLGRAGCPEDVARAVAFLASESNGFITGATIDINGGCYAC
ncbi:glucose 1-dehydrogenase [Rubellicoccus peritrichatus]|uniref:Glucose 1-dehydrogenase n=1 Tax=Rubellicoccus peritrichatus TaxID=3080537 RepID=A0AAQ3L5X0_9BACT|nr:glucose 1-dehydrogenase [Puniceicoccus sp. CR14]WOO40049.1 glucose 1-dehydrogenase [Puniceicoccus sp. CR14]